MSTTQPTPNFTSKRLASQSDASTPESSSAHAVKRRKLSIETPASSSSQIKREDSPPALPARRLVTEGAKYYATPENCRKSHPEHYKNRKEWQSSQKYFYDTKRLTIHKVLWREDGVAIDWYVLVR